LLQLLFLRYVRVDGLWQSSNTKKPSSQHEAKLKQKVIQVKEVKFRPGTDDGDYGVKLRSSDPLFGRRRQDKDYAYGFEGVKWLTKNWNASMLDRLKIDLEPYGVSRAVPKDGRSDRW
jgi:translation initiation factor IF-3